MSIHIVEIILNFLNGKLWFLLPYEDMFIVVVQTYKFEMEKFDS